MITSMTGYGKASKRIGGHYVTVELRSVNSKYFDVFSRLPAVFNERENDIREIVAKKITRGKIAVTISIEKETDADPLLKLKSGKLKSVKKLLEDIKKEISSDEKIKLKHILHFSEIFGANDYNEFSDRWDEVKKLIAEASDDLNKMKFIEGKVLEKDIMKRVSTIERKVESVKHSSERSIKKNKKILKNKITDKLSGEIMIEESRIEAELVLLSDKLDITEEAVRTVSHLDYFRKNVNSKEHSGRRLNFLLQEINREINTMASKSNNAFISQQVVEMKEELEKIREQLQNVE